MSSYRVYGSTYDAYTGLAYTVGDDARLHSPGLTMLVNMSGQGRQISGQGCHLDNVRTVKKWNVSHADLGPTA